MTALLLSLVTVLSTSAGGLVAFRLGQRLHLLLGFTAGALLGVVCFDLLPEIFELAARSGSDASGAMVALVGGFLLFHGLETFVLVHPAHEDEYAHHHHPGVGGLSAAALVGHSLVDGIGMGLAFQVSPALGLTTALAVVAHDFCDGLNTVRLMLLHRNTKARARAMLAANALAPLLGAASTLAYSVPAQSLVLGLGFFAGLLLYMGVSDILPQAHSRAGAADAMRSIGSMVLGAGCIHAALRWAG
jgi:ZIP family zinc transporter